MARQDVKRVVVRDGAIVVGGRVQVTFQRTLRIPDDGRSYPLPPGLGTLPVLAASEAGTRVPAGWRRPGTFLVPMYQREALWLGFANDWPPVAITVTVGGVNAVSGRTGHEGLHADPQDYVVCPDQMWLDGVNAGPATVRQFVAMPLGEGYSVEAAVTGEERRGGLEITVFPPRRGARLTRPAPSGGPMKMATPRMGLGAGGRIVQKIYPDPHGVSVWDTGRATRLSVHLVNSLAYRALTGREPPPTPIGAKTYSERGYPWFSLYEEDLGDVAAPGVLGTVKTIAERDRERGRTAEDEGFEVDPSRITPLTRRRGGPPCPKE